jgi:hypothetical protein
VPLDTVPPEPACRRPTDALSRSLSSPSHPIRCHQALPHPGPAHQACSPCCPRRPLPPPSPVCAAMVPLTPDGQGPLPAASSYRPPRPLSSFYRLHADAPTPTPLFPLCPVPPSLFFKSAGHHPIALFSAPFTQARASSPSLPALQAREALLGHWTLCHSTSLGATIAATSASR